MAESFNVSNFSADKPLFLQDSECLIQHITFVAMNAGALDFSLSPEIDM